MEGVASGVAAKGNGTMTKELREVKEVKVPSLWKFDPCKKHEDYVVGCGGCEEEVLTARLEKAYLAGHAAAASGTVARGDTKCAYLRQNDGSRRL